MIMSVHAKGALDTTRTERMGRRIHVEQHTHAKRMQTRVMFVLPQLAQVPLKSIVRRSLQIAGERPLDRKRSEQSVIRFVELRRPLRCWEQLSVSRGIG